MAFLTLFIVAAALGAVGYLRGALRLCLALSPALLPAIFLWLFGPMCYRIDALRNAGLAWPGLILSCAGAICGYALHFVARKKLPEKIHQADRICGSFVGLFLSLIVVWLGCVYFIMWSAQGQPGRNPGSARVFARSLNSTVLGWMPGIGSGSNAMMGMMEFATADEDTRRRAVESLDLDPLFELPETQAVVNHAETTADVRRAAEGDVAALWRLQKNPRVLRLLETDAFAELLDGRTFADLAAAVRSGEGSAEGD